MLYLVSFLILLGLIKLLDQDGRPLLCSGIYTFLAVIFQFLYTGEVNALQYLIFAVIVFLSSSLYFWLLYKLQGYGFIRVIVAVVGILIGLI